MTWIMVKPRTHNDLDEGKGLTMSMTWMRVKPRVTATLSLELMTGRTFWLYLFSTRARRRCSSGISRVSL